MKVGLLGGSFNPAHAGHAHLAETAMRRLGLDRVIWLVSPQNPLKDPRASAPLEARLASARRLARGPRMLVSDLEAKIGTRHTLDVVRLLKRRFPGVRFVWLMGADNLLGLHRWRGWPELLREVPAAVVSRPGSAVRSRFSPAARRFAFARRAASPKLPLAVPPAWSYLPGPLHAQASSAIRAGEGLR